MKTKDPDRAMVEIDQGVIHLVSIIAPQPLTQDPTKASVMYRCVPCGAILDPDTTWGSDCHHCGAVVHFMQEVRIICAARQLQRQHDQEDQADLYAMHLAWGEALR